MSLRRLLAALTLASALSLLVLGAVSISLLASAERARFESQLALTARSLALGVDRQLGAAAAVVETLAAAPALAAGDLAAFEAQARAAASAGQLVGLVDRDKRQRFNTALPAGRAASAADADVVLTANPEHAARTLAADETLVSDLFLGARTRQPLVMVARRVLVDGAWHALTLGVPARELGAILREAQMPEGWVAAVLDRADVTVARTRAEDAIVGQPATGPVRALLAQGDGGVLRGIRTADGMPATVAVARAPATGFAVAIAGPEPSAIGWLARVYGPFLPLGLALTAGATALSVLLARRLLRAVNALAAPAAPRAPTGLREIDEVADRLRRAEDARALLAGELAHRIKNLFAVTTGLVAAAAREAPEHRDFARALSERFTALARATELGQPDGSGSGDGGGGGVASVHALLRVLLAPYLDRRRGDGASPPVAVDGEDVALGPAAAQALALAVHELATNALKHGALGADGRVDVRTARRGGRFELVWVERGGPPVAGPPNRAGFGTSLATTTIERQLRGTLRRDWDAEGLRVTASVPLESLAA